MTTTTWTRGSEVAVYEMGDLRGTPAKATLDTVAEVRASTFKLASGKVFTFGGREYGQKYGRYSLRRVDDPDVIRVLNRQKFEALRDEVVRLAQDTGQEHEERLEDARLVLRGEEDHV